MSVRDIYRRVLDEIAKIDPRILIDVCADLYNDQRVREDFSEFFPDVKVEANPAQAVAAAVAAVLDQKPGWHRVLGKIIRRAREYLEMSDEELRAEFEKDLPISILGHGISPQLLIFYIIACQRQYRHPRLPFLIEEYRKISRKIPPVPPEVSERVKLEGELRSSFLETELNLFLADQFEPKDDERIARAAHRFLGEYDPATRTVRVPRGLIMFLEFRLGLLKSLDEELSRQAEALYDYSLRAYRILEKAAGVHRRNEELDEEVKRLRERLKEAEAEKDALRTRLEAASTPEDLQAEILRLRQELESAHRRIRHLEARLAELEEEKKILPEIREDVEVVPERPVLRKVEIEPLSRIVVSGGYWTSRDEEEIEQLLAPLGCTVRFIPAEETLRYPDAFRSADLVFFDTSRHAHAFFEKVRSLNPRVVLVRGKRELKELVQRSAFLESRGGTKVGRFPHP